MGSMGYESYRGLYGSKGNTVGFLRYEPYRGLSLVVWAKVWAAWATWAEFCMRLAGLEKINKCDHTRLH